MTKKLYTCCLKTQHCSYNVTVANRDDDLITLTTCVRVRIANWSNYLNRRLQYGNGEREKIGYWTYDVKIHSTATERLRQLRANTTEII